MIEGIIILEMVYNCIIIFLKNRKYNKIYQRKIYIIDMNDIEYDVT